MLPTTREELKAYCLRRLGFPVINIDVSNEQVEDRIDEAVDLFQTWHEDGTEHAYTSILITADLIANNSHGVTPQGVQMPANTFGVNKIFILEGGSTTNMSQGGFNMFDINYQIRLNELYDYTAGDYTYFVLANEHLRILEMYFTGDIPIRYNRYNNILFIDCSWAERMYVGSYIIAEVYVSLSETTAFWQDPWLMNYTECLIKEQWGMNLKKFHSVSLPGGMLLNGKEIYDEAVAEKVQLVDDLHHKYQMPAEWLVG